MIATTGLPVKSRSKNGCPFEISPKLGSAQFGASPKLETDGPDPHDGSEMYGYRAGGAVRSAELAEDPVTVPRRCRSQADNVGEAPAAERTLIRSVAEGEHPAVLRDQSVAPARARRRNTHDRLIEVAAAQ